ncbi:transcriptional regulator [Naasia lichenicola]|uniref:Transcriptional regulator n=1 Tax=Naasia lichenicola TaxID=2565933 RepID=A0A4S4FP17_9MICO|nr:transcriptional regulator [Naasia lichenicola]THG32310.1 transcriptional regulator [Naasia lichenicola]
MGGDAVRNPWLASPGSAVPVGRAPRALVAESWKRALVRLDPERVAAPLVYSEEELLERRRLHPLTPALPVIRQLLVRDADEDSQVLVAVGDEAGRLLWVEGDPVLRRRAEGMHFMAGAGWSESDVGTSAPGTALALDHGIQIHGAEHFAFAVQPWSCTAVPVHDPETRAIIGVLDITGGSDVVAPHTLPMIEAAVAAVERELLVHRLRAAAERPLRRSPRRRIETAPSLRALGRDAATVTANGRTTALSARHSEIMTLLAWNPSGIGAERLAELVYDRDDATVTLRAEMVRLRRALHDAAPALEPLARPYRLPSGVELDVANVVGLLDRGAHRAAVTAWSGGPLPGSSAPGIVQLRDEVASRIREALLDCAAPDVLLAWANTPDGADDERIWRAALHGLPRHSPKRAGVVAHLELLEQHSS